LLRLLKTVDPRASFSGRSFVKFTRSGVAPGVSYTDHRPLIHRGRAHTIRLELTFMAR